MQPIVAPVRSGYTKEQITELIQSSAFIVGAGAELLNMNLDVLENITDDLVGGTIRRSNYATLHGSASLDISRELPWGRAIVRPYMTIESGSMSVRFNLGAFFTNTPERVLGTQPLTYSVECYDLLHALDTPAGEAHQVFSGTRYLDAVEEILTAQGFTRIIIDRTRATTTLPATKVWPIAENTTWLIIVNDLLAAIGYRGIWSDWDGYLRCESYETPATRQPEWTYNATSLNSMLGQTRTYTRDFYAAPNRWVAVRNGQITSDTPVEGNGIYTEVNQNNGETSISARGGRVITRLLTFDAADQAALIAQTKSAIENDLTLKTKITVETSPNPLHGHFDVVTLVDAEAGANLKLIESSWELPLLGGDMKHEWSTI